MALLRVASLTTVLFTGLCTGICSPRIANNTHKHAELLAEHFDVSVPVARQDQPMSLGPWQYEITDYYVVPSTDEMFDHSIQKQHPHAEVAIVVYRFNQQNTLSADANPATFFRDGQFQKHHAHPTATSNVARASGGRWHDPWYLPTAAYGEWVYTAEAFILPKETTESASFGVASEEVYERDVFFWTRRIRRQHVAMFDLGAPSRERPSFTVASN